MPQTKMATQSRDIVYAPNEAARLVLAAVEERRKNPGAGIRLGVPCVDGVLLPLRPGELITVMGRSSDYKSGLMQFWGRQVSQDIVRENAEHDIAVYVTWEMAVEELALYDLATAVPIDAAALAQGQIDDQDWERLEAAAMRRAVLPLWLLGHSIERRKKRPRLTMTNIAKALMWVENEMGFHPRIVFFDYLQQMEAEGGETRRLQVFENVHRCKDMALALGCPVVLGCQARREVDEREWKLATMRDAMESSNIENTSDKMISVWMPKRTEYLGDTIKLGDRRIEVTENLLVMGLIKQKLGPAGNVWALYVDPTTNRIGEMTDD